MEILLKKPKRGRTYEDQLYSVIEDRTLGPFDVGIFARIWIARQKQEEESWYIDEKDKLTRHALSKLEDSGFLKVE
jgi:hypothetical protein